jgi:hypothetical protein
MACALGLHLTLSLKRLLISSNRHVCRGRVEQAVGENVEVDERFVTTSR